MATRLAGRYGYPKDDPFKVTFHPDRLDEPLHWKKPSRIFVCSMGDIFHENVTFEMIKQVFMHAANSKRHTYLFLTKRPQRMVEVICWFLQFAYQGEDGYITLPSLPKNFWLGVSVEDQKTANERIPILLQIPAAKRWVSVEPTLGPVDLSGWLFIDEKGDSIEPPIQWVVMGGETGPHARPLHPDWVRSLRDQCQTAGVPFFFKGWGEYTLFLQRIHGSKTGDIPYYPYGHGSPYKMIGGDWFKKVGKKAAGRLLDGKIWEEYP
jgi:protein gp37